MSKGERLGYYILFILVAAPIEIALCIAFGLAKGSYETLMRPISQALLYLYAFILASETRFRVAQHGASLLTAPQRVLLNLTTFGVFALFVLHYCLTLYDRIEQREDVSGTWFLQALALVFAVFASILSYYCVEINRANDEGATA